MGKWKKVEEHKPTDFVSVLGHMTDAGEFPSVRECYLIDGQHFFFPALGEVHPVDKWIEMPAVDDIPTVNVIEVVRCQGCKHSRQRNRAEKAYLVEGVLICTNPECSEDGWYATWPDHWCSYGERRAD